MKIKRKENAIERSMPSPLAAIFLVRITNFVRMVFGAKVIRINPITGKKNQDIRSIIDI